jgi:AAA domain/DnaB-like helicase N terminal domain
MRPKKSARVDAVIPPHDADMERAVLGAALADPGACAHLLALPTELFYFDTHRRIAETCRRLHAATGAVDLVGVAHALQAAGDRAAGEALTLAVEAATIAATVPGHCQTLRDLQCKRRLQQLAESLRIGALNGTPARELVADLRRAVEELGPAPTLSFPLYDAADPWDFPAPAFIVDQLLPARGTVWIGGLPKRGKSLLTLYLALAIACGRESVCHRFAVRSAPKILYVIREDGGPRLQARRDDILAAWPDMRPAPGRLLIAIKPHIDLLHPPHIAWLRETCQRDERTVLILDTWTALSPQADPLSPKDQAQLAAIVVQLAEDIEGVVGVLDHSRKNRPEGQILSSADIFGAPQKWAAAEHVLMLDHAGGDETRWEIFVEGKDCDSTRFFLTKSAQGSGQEKLVYAGSAETVVAAARATGDANRQAVLAALQQAGAWVRIGVLKAALAAAGRPLADDTIHRHLDALIAQGVADQAGKGSASRYRALESPQGASAVIIPASKDPG